jgi:outer membrane immunogenic protein
MRWTVSSLAALALAVSLQPTRAADLPGMPVKAPYATPVYNWYGFYIGGHIGYGWGSDPITFSGATGTLALIGAPPSIADDARGLIGGLQWGSNYQFGSWVLGIDSDFSWTDIHSSQTITTARVNFGDQKLEWLSTTRGRVGYLIQPNLLIFGSGGVADGRTKVSVSNTVAGIGAFGNASENRWGWAAGAGIEYAWDTWLLRLEYLHYDLGDLNFTYRDTIGAGTLTSSTRFAGDIVRGAISYKFNWTPLDLLLGKR